MSKPIVLVVDSEAYYRELFRDMFSGESECLVETAASFEAAAARLDRGGIDLLVCALDLPDKRAIDLLRQARAGAHPPAVILLNDDPADATALHSLRLGAYDCIPKSCHPVRLRHLIGNCLAQQQLQRDQVLLQRKLQLQQRGQHLGTLLEMDALLQELLTILHQETGATLRSLAFVANRTGLVSVVTGDGLNDQQAAALAQALLPQLPAVAGGMVSDASALQVTGVLDDLRSLWVFPLHADNAMQGALVLANAAGMDLPATFPAEALRLEGTQAIVPFRNACRYLGARELIYTDDLTGLHNYRFLQISLEREISRAHRYNLEFSIAFIDLDLFKRVNDTHGHLVGSSVLREVGAILRRSVRETDMLFRYGGDEFMVLLVGTDSSGAKVVAERIRRGIEAHAFSAGQGKTCRVTATVGFATYPTHTTSRQQLIDLADQAMYRGKQSRNVSCGAGPDHQP